MSGSITIYTDGSCNAKTMVGGAGAYVIFQDKDGNEYENLISKGFIRTKTGRMEITAVILALESIKLSHRGRHPIRIVSDSQYVVNSIRKWLKYWEQDGLDNRTNGDLWKRFLEVFRTYPDGCVTVSWCKGHAGTFGNEVADMLAGLAYRSGEYEEDLSLSDCVKDRDDGRFIIISSEG